MTARLDAWRAARARALRARDPERAIEDIDRALRAEIYDALGQTPRAPSPLATALDGIEGDDDARVEAVHLHLLAHPLTDGAAGPTVAHDAKRRKDFGVVYTPAPLVDALVDEALAPLAHSVADVLRLRVVDPACGTGAFLVGAYRWLLARCAGVPDAPARALRCLYGVDLDADALALAARALRRASGVTDDLSDRLVRADALSMDWRATFPEALADGGFDAVIGNPPYVSYAGRQSVPLPSARRRELARRFPAASRWPSAHGFFIELASREVSRDVVAFVVPDQVAHLERYAPLREALRSTHGLRALKFHGEDAFRGVVTPALSFVASRAHDGATRMTDARGEAVTRALARGAPWVPRAPDARWERLREGAVSIADHVVDRGIRTTDAGRQVVALRDARAGDLPVLEGACVRRYRCDPPARALRLDAGAPSPRVADDARWDEVAFVLRQTAGHPIVGPRRHVRHFRNSLLGLRATPGGLDLRYLVGLLNSALMRMIYEAHVQESAQRSFPQVKKSYLAALPIRVPRNAFERARRDDVIDGVTALLADPSRADLDAAVDAAVLALYGVGDDELARLRSFAPGPR